MRKKRPIDALFPKIRQGILATTYGMPEKWWFLSEIANRIKTTSSSLQREIASLVESGILRERRDGKRLYFQAESNSPLFAPLRELIAQTVGLTVEIKEALLLFADKIRVAFVYGSVAHGEEHALSDIDILTVGNVGLSDLSSLLHDLESKFNREINVTCYSPAEFAKKVQNQNHFLTSVLKKEKIFLLGDKNELDRLAYESNSSESYD